MDQTDFASFVDFNLDRRDGRRDCGGIVLLSRVQDIGPASPEPFGVVRERLIELLPDRHAELSFAIGAHLVHDAPRGNDARIRVAVAHELVLFGAIGIIHE